MRLTGLMRTLLLNAVFSTNKKLVPGSKSGEILPRMMASGCYLVRLL